MKLLSIAHIRDELFYCDVDHHFKFIVLVDRNSILVHYFHDEPI